LVDELDNAVGTDYDAVHPMRHPSITRNITPTTPTNRTLALSGCLIFILVTLGGVAIAPAQTSSSKHSASIQSQPSDNVVDQIGVNIHLSFYNTPYGKFDSIVRPRLSELGIRHIRDGALTAGNSGALQTYYKRLSALAADGIKSSLVTFDATSPAVLTDLNRLEAVFNDAGRGVEFFEGTNEPNLKKNPSWADIGRDRQKALYEATHSNPNLSRVAVIGPSPWGTDAQQLGDISASVDFGNWHIYSGGQYPEAAGKASLEDYLEQARGLYSSKPIVATEAGYHSAMNVAAGKHRPTPEKIIARYLPRLILWNLKHGVIRTYLYELVDSFARGDTDPESNFGLIRYDGSPKPSFHAIKNLIGIFSDSGAVPNPQKLDWSLTSKDPEIQTMLFQRSDGSFLLALWLGVPAWDPDQRTEVAAKSVATDIILPATIGKATVSEFIDDGTLTARDEAIQGSRLSVMVKDTMTVIRLQ
jgi:hypothetical protein